MCQAGVSRRNRISSQSYSQRPPTYVKPLAGGLRIVTGTFELGDPNLGKEDSISLDLSIRKNSGYVTGAVSAFYYRFNEFISQQPTDDDFEEDGEYFPIFAYGAGAAAFHGAEVESTPHLLKPVSGSKGFKPSNHHLDLAFRADYVQAEDRETEEALFRIPPFRSSLLLAYQL